MKNRIKVIASLLLISSFLFLHCVSQVKTNNSNAPLKLAATIRLPNVNGRIDHMAYNSKQQLVYVAALGNNTVEVVDLKSQKVIHAIKGLDEPQGIRYIPETNTIFVANGGNGECRVFDAGTYQQVGVVKLGGDADNVRYDPISHKIYVGYGDGAIAVIDVKTLKQVADIKLPAHPESFQLGNHQLFVNLPDAHLLDVIDLNRNAIIASWKVEKAASNFPMALDTANHRLFIGCRHPAKLLVMDSKTGKTITSLDTNGDTDDIFYDNVSKALYMSCGSGSLDFFRQMGINNYESVGNIETRSGARTSLWIPELNRLIVAAPARGGNEAQLMIYDKR